VGLCAAGGERVLPVAVEEESRRRRPCLAVARRRAAAPAAPLPRALTRAPLGELPTLGFVTEGVGPCGLWLTSLLGGVLSAVRPP